MKYFPFVILVAMLLLSACQPANPSAPDGDQEPTTSQPDGGSLDTQGFIDALVSAGATAVRESEIEQPFFSVPGQIITVNGESIQVFEYADAAQADVDAGQVAPDGGSIGTTMATWVGPPHFYRAERLIVLYVGEDQSVIELLETVLGPQFAGADTPRPPDASTEPPAAVLQIGELEQVSGIGSYCWTAPSEEVGICADAIGIPSPPDAMVTESPFIAHFINPLSTPLDSLVLSITPVDLEERMSTEVGGMYWWAPDPQNQSNRHLAPPHEVELSLEPGLYLLNYFAQWEEFGDASYGFLVEVPTAQGSEPLEEEPDISVVVILAEAGLNLRSEPDLSSEVIGYLPHSDLVDVIGQSPDGDWWQVVCPEDVSGNCWISADPILSEPVNLTEVSLAGLIYAQNDQQPERPMWLIGTDGTPTLFLENSNGYGVLSPDGIQMISCCYPRGETNLYLINPETAESLQLTDTPDRYNYNPQWWQANPETIVFVSNVFNPNDQPRPGPGNLALVNIDGTGFQVLDSERIVRTSFSLSPDGQTIAYTHGDESADESGILTPWLYDLETGPESYNYSEFGLNDLPDLSFGNPAWSPDGRYLAWVVGGELTGDGEWKNGIAVFDLEEQSVEILNPHVPASCLFAWCPETPVWSPDGQWLAWQIAPEGGVPSLLVMRPDGTEQQQFDYGVGPVWSPDSRHIVFSNILENLTPLVMEVGQWQPQRTGLPANIGPILWISLDK
jgi:Tol biopolymer transport system component